MTTQSFKSETHIRLYQLASKLKAISHLLYYQPESQTPPLEREEIRKGASALLEDCSRELRQLAEEVERPSDKQSDETVNLTADEDYHAK